MGTAKAKINDILEKVGALRAGRLATACEDSGAKELAWARNFLLGVLEYSAPTGVQVASYDSSRQDFICKVESVLVVMVQSAADASIPKNSLKAVNL